MDFVRNLRTPTLTATWSAHATVLYTRELLLLAGWTDQLITGGPIGPSADPAWAATLIVDEPGGVNGFEVVGTSPRIIYDPAGRFTQAMADGTYAIFLHGVNNRGGWSIFRYIDANHVEISGDGPPPTGWVNETGMPGRIIDPKQQRLATAISCLLQAPSSNLQARVLHSTTSACLVFARPKGGAALATEVPAAGEGCANGTDTWLRFNAVLDGKNVIILWRSATGTRWIQLGELDDVDTGDTDPGFIWVITVPGAHVAYYSGYMLSSADAEIEVWATFIKQFTGDDDSTSYQRSRTYLLVNGRPGKVQLRKPKVMMSNVVGEAGIRGKLPIIRHANQHLEWHRPLDAAGDWIHMLYGLVLPRNGPNDQIPFIGG